VRGMTDQSINQIHSLYPLHSHQLHIPQPDIVPFPNALWMMHSGEACHHAATEILVRECLCGKSLINQSIIQLIIQIHSQHSPYSLQLHISQSDIASRPNVHCMMPIGQACYQPATKDKVGAAETRKSRTWVERSEC
jgi:hypothetical protein